MDHKVGSFTRTAVMLGALFVACQVSSSGDEADTQRASAQIQSELDAAARSDPSTFNSVRPVRPVVTCIATASDDQLVAHFGYVSTAPGRIAIPVGFFNRFWRAPLDRGQPSAFDPGSHPDVVSATFSRSGTLIWVLGVHFAIASRFSQPCPRGGAGGAGGGDGGGAGGQGAAGGTGGAGATDGLGGSGGLSGAGGLGGAGGLVGAGGDRASIPCSDPSSCDDHNPCTLDIPERFEVGYGCVCEHPWAANGISCRDACAQIGACQSGTCIGGPNTTCPAPDQCHLPGSCSAPGEVCANAQAPFGRPCDAGGGPSSGACDLSGACLPAGSTFACGTQTCTPGSSYCRELRGIAGAGGTNSESFGCLSFRAGCTTADCSCTSNSPPPIGYMCIFCQGSASTGILQGCFTQ